MAPAQNGDRSGAHVTTHCPFSTTLFSITDHLIGILYHSANACHSKTQLNKKSDIDNNVPEDATFFNLGEALRVVHRLAARLCSRSLSGCRACV
jgi:hypothetical protein